MVGIYNLARALQKKYYLNTKRQNYDINGILWKIKQGLHNMS